MSKLWLVLVSGGSSWFGEMGLVMCRAPDWRSRISRQSVWSGAFLDDVAFSTSFVLFLYFHQMRFGLFSDSSLWVSVVALDPTSSSSPLTFTLSGLLYIFMLLINILSWSLIFDCNNRERRSVYVLKVGIGSQKIGLDAA